MRPPRGAMDMVGMADQAQHALGTNKEIEDAISTSGHQEMIMTNLSPPDV